jgi:hypothetical protein
MLYILFLGFTLPIFAIDNISDPRIRVAYGMIMQKYESDSSAAIVDAATNEYKLQFGTSKIPANVQVMPYDAILQQYQDYSDSQMKKAAEVVYHSLNDLSQNTYQEYYVWNESLQIWSLPGESAAPNVAVDGAAMNARILSSKIKLSLINSLDHEGSGIKKRRFPNPFRLFKSASPSMTPHKVMDPNDIKLGWWRATFGRARMRTAVNLFFKPKIVQVYFSIGAIGYLYFICRYVFGKPSENTNERGADSSTNQPTINGKYIFFE